MGNSKITYFGQTLIDLTGDTVDAAHLAQGYTAHDKAGNVITGTMSESSGGSITIATKSVTPSSASTTFAITGLAGQPKFFSLHNATNITLSSTRYVLAFHGYNGTGGVVYGYKSGSNAYVYQSATYGTYTYSNGTLTLKTSSSTNGGNFYRGAYTLVYGY